MVPMTLISFWETRPPTDKGVAMRFIWTTVSTSACVMILAIIGFRMSARTNSALPMSSSGGMTSKPMTRLTPGWAVSRRTKARHHRDGPRMKRALLLVATLVTRLAQQLAVLLLRHALAALLDD